MPKNEYDETKMRTMEVPLTEEEITGEEEKPTAFSLSVAEFPTLKNFKKGADISLKGNIGEIAGDIYNININAVETVSPKKEKAPAKEETLETPPRVGEIIGELEK